MAVDQLTYTGTLKRLTCWCSIRFAVPEELADKALTQRHTVYCPLGHSCVWKQTEADELHARIGREEQRAARLTAQLDQARADAEHERRRANGYKGALVKTKARAAKGVCPVPGCQRHFVDVERHVATKHPDYTAGA